MKEKIDLSTELLKLADKEYAVFQSRLTPTLPSSAFLGVRVPVLRKFAAEYKKSPDASRFLRSLPHGSYDENMLHGLLINTIKDYEEALVETERFLPYVDNWAVCDIFSPKIFRKHKEELLPKIREWTRSDRPYTVRFGIEMLMSHYLDADFRPEYLDIPAAVVSDEYYVNMMIAWFFATALTKQWDAAVPYIEKRGLPVWVHRKTIQKACESYCISAERKEYLKSFR